MDVFAAKLGIPPHSAASKPKAKVRLNKKKPRNMRGLIFLYKNPMLIRIIGAAKAVGELLP